MTTYSDRQPLCCQNTFTSVYHLSVNNYQITRNTKALGHNPVPHLSPYGEGVRNCANSKIDKQLVLHVY